MRAKFQVLVIPFKKVNGIAKYIILKRADLKVWQGIAGGGEGDESAIEAAKREANEELNIDSSCEYIQLDSVASIPAIYFKDHVKLWGKKTLVIPEYCFGVEINECGLRLSDEHSEYKWCSYEEAIKLLEWDSNKVALWELNERIRLEILND